MEHIPFTFGKVVFELDFTNREEETASLLQQFKALNSVSIISPRRWGKTSLIKHVTQKLQKENKNYRIVYLDLFNIKTEEEFYREYTNKLINASIGKFDVLVKKSGVFFKSLIPKLSYKPVPESEISVSLAWDEIKKRPSEILDLPQKIANSEGLKIIFCIDEFQNLNQFDDPLSFQKRLRAHWQHHSQVSYCLYGSQEHMMQEIFNKPSYPFYRFATIVNLSKIKAEKWHPFINKRFTETGKTIDKSAIDRIVNYADNQPYYVQQLAQNCWLLCEKHCEAEIVDLALENILEQYKVFFIRETEGLSALQVNYLRALNDEVEHFGSKENLNKYQLNSTANINRIKKAMEQKQILRYVKNKPEFQDAIFGLWLKKVYFS